MGRQGIGKAARKLLGAFSTLRFIAAHPLNRKRKFAAIRRFLSWQISSRLAPGPIAINFANDSKLLVSTGMTGATGNIYTGLHEFEDMSFVVHALREHDLFVDVGANIGSYAILAGAVAGANCIAFEPIPVTYRHLVRNIHLNDLGDKVAARNIGIGKEAGELRFTSGLDTINHVLSENEESETSVSVLVKTLDEAVGAAHPAVIKIDVEGFETSVVDGAPVTLRKESLLAVVIELNGSGSRYGFDENALHRRMLGYAFHPVAYSPLDRRLIPLEGKNYKAGNTIYVRDIKQVQSRLNSANRFFVNGQSV